MGKRYKRLGFTEAQSQDLWDRWQRGERLTSIGDALGKALIEHLESHQAVWRHSSAKTLSITLGIDVI